MIFIPNPATIIENLIKTSIVLGIFNLILSPLLAQSAPPSGSVFFIDNLQTTPPLPSLPDTVFILKPRYDNPVQTRNLVPLVYDVEKIASQQWLDSLTLGTHLISISAPLCDSIITLNPFGMDSLIVYQIVKKSQKGYLGFLEEMLGVPFVLPPRYLRGLGHQSDLRLAVDCAEMAIYARRRQGHEVPYGGPRGIRNYVVPSDTLIAGTILHFGHQVSVLYKDRGVIGTLEKNDLLIHAYKDKAEIIRLGETDLDSRLVSFFIWRE
ncbi:MAG: hypothetical protein AB8F95_05015 [Bacteroidia bacterium]